MSLSDNLNRLWIEQLEDIITETYASREVMCRDVLHTEFRSYLRTHHAISVKYTVNTHQQNFCKLFRRIQFLSNCMSMSSTGTRLAHNKHHTYKAITAVSSYVFFRIEGWSVVVELSRGPRRETGGRGEWGHRLTFFATSHSHIRYHILDSPSPLCSRRDQLSLINQTTKL